MRFHILLGAILPALGTSAAAAERSAPEPRDVVHTAERAVSDDSLETVRARWSAALARDSTDRAAALGLGSLSRLTYDFPAAERHFTSILARGGPRDEWSVQARLGLYRVALASGDNTRSDSLVTIALEEARTHRGPRQRDGCADRTQQHARRCRRRGVRVSPRWTRSGRCSRRATAGSAPNTSAAWASSAESRETPPAR